MIARRAVQAQETSDIGTSLKTSNHQNPASVSSFATPAPDLKDVVKKVREVVTCGNGSEDGKVVQSSGNQVRAETQTTEGR